MNMMVWCCRCFCSHWHSTLCCGICLTHTHTNKLTTSNYVVIIFFISLGSGLCMYIGKSEWDIFFVFALFLQFLWVVDFTRCIFSLFHTSCGNESNQRIFDNIFILSLVFQFPQLEKYISVNSKSQWHSGWIVYCHFHHVYEWMLWENIIRPHYEYNEDMSKER